MTRPSSRASAYYSRLVDQFLGSDPYEVLGALTAAHIYDLEVEQRRAWEEQLKIFTVALRGLTGTLYLEFDVPHSIASLGVAEA